MAASSVHWVNFGCAVAASVAVTFAAADAVAVVVRGANGVVAFLVFDVRVRPFVVAVPASIDFVPWAFERIDGF